MIFFGHLGIGSKLVSPWTQGLSYRWVLVGTVLPDLIDKPLYYGLSLLTGQKGAELGLISCTRTFGHTGVFLVGLAFFAFARKSKLFAALALGAATHLILDNLGDHFHAEAFAEESSAFMALVFPIMSKRFAVAPFQSASEHLTRLANTYTILGEVIGIAILAWDYWKTSHKGEILSDLENRRIKRHLLRKKKTASHLQ